MSPAGGCAGSRAGGGEQPPLPVPQPPLPPPFPTCSTPLRVLPPADSSRAMETLPNSLPSPSERERGADQPGGQGAASASGDGPVPAAQRAGSRAGSAALARRGLSCQGAEPPGPMCEGRQRSGLRGWRRGIFKDNPLLKNIEGVGVKERASCPRFSGRRSVPVTGFGLKSPGDALSARCPSHGTA